MCSCQRNPVRTSSFWFFLHLLLLFYPHLPWMFSYFRDFRTPVFVCRTTTHEENSTCAFQNKPALPCTQRQGHLQCWQNAEYNPIFTLPPPHSCVKECDFVKQIKISCRCQCLANFLDKNIVQNAIPECKHKAQQKSSRKLLISWLELSKNVVFNF